jgi:hypothetical protein
MAASAGATDNRTSEICRINDGSFCRPAQQPG